MLREMYYFKEDREGFSSNLKKLIKENGFTANDVVSKLGDSYFELLKKWKTGERLPTLEDLSKLSKIFNVSMEELYLPNAQLNIKNNEYNNLFINSNINKLDLLDKFYPSFYKDKFKDDWITIEEFNKQKDFKEEINYLLQKKLFSYLTEKEDEKLRFYFKVALSQRHYDEDGGARSSRVDYDSFWKSVDEDLRKRRGLSYKYKMNKTDMKEEYFEFKKKIDFSPDKHYLPQTIIIEDVLELLKDKETIKAYINQFDEVVINCIYSMKNISGMVKEALKDIGAKRISINIPNNISVIDELLDEVRKLSYEEYLISIGGEH